MKRDHLLLAGAALLLLVAVLWWRHSMARARAANRPQTQAATSVNGLVGHYFPAPGPAGVVLAGETAAPPTPNPQPLSPGYNPTFSWSPLAGPGLAGY